MTVFKSILNENTACLLLYGEISDEGGEGKIASRLDWRANGAFKPVTNGDDGKGDQE